MSSKRVFITGGASGLGRALAQHYAKAGWRVLIGDVQDERAAETMALLKASGQPSHYLRCDVTSDADIEQAAAWLQSNWNGVDVVINNAGVAASGRIEDIPMDDWRWIIDINLLGVVRGCRTFVPMLKKQKSGHIVNISSLAGLVNPPLMSPYNAVKTAVVSLSETLFSELLRDGINVSVVCPSFFRTNLMESSRGRSDTQKRAKSFVERSPYGAEEIAALVFEGIEKRQFRILPDHMARRTWRLKCSMPFKIFAPMLRRQLRF